jgi:hypothetical protein
MESPTGLIPEELMSAGMKPQVLDFLLAQPWPGDFKLQVLSGWGQVVNNHITAADRASVAASGWK